MRHLSWMVLGLLALVVGSAIREVVLGYGMAADAIDQRNRHDALDDATSTTAQPSSLERLSA